MLSRPGYSRMTFLLAVLPLIWYAPQDSNLQNPVSKTVVYANSTRGALFGVRRRIELLCTGSQPDMGPSLPEHYLAGPVGLEPTTFGLTVRCPHPVGLRPIIWRVILESHQFH